MSLRCVVVLCLCPPALLASQPDVLIVGAGAAGLSAALDGARAGLRVTVIDRNSVPGGHAVVATGVMLVGSPLQKKNGVVDSPDLAYKDFLDWGKDANPQWARYYAENSQRELGDWMTAMGVEFDNLSTRPGNSVPRFHAPKGNGMAMIHALYREVLRQGGIEFLWNCNVAALRTNGARVTGLAIENLRTGDKAELSANTVLLTTGGYENNFDLVRGNWPKQYRLPERILIGSGHNSTGSGLNLAKEAGAAVRNLDHQWIYAPGIPNPFDPDGKQGMYANSGLAIWVNMQGKRFASEMSDMQAAVRAVSSQRPGHPWMIFDANGRDAFHIVHVVWDAEPRKSMILDYPGLVPRGDTLEDLAAKAGLPAKDLVETVTHYNQMLADGNDTDFGRPFSSPYARRFNFKPMPIAKPPFYAVPIYPVTRKSMGGIEVDIACRALDEHKQPIPGLFAAGEVSGFGGINGSAGLEGTFLGPAFVMGRVAARTIAAELKTKPVLPHDDTQMPDPKLAVAMPIDPAANKACLACHNIPALVKQNRGGYWHFEQSHTIVMERKLACMSCHAELTPFRPEAHKVNRTAQIEVCRTCHSRGS